MHCLQLKLFIYWLIIIIMEVSRIKNTYRVSTIARALLVIAVSSFLVSPSIIDSVYSAKNSTNLDQKIVAKLSKEVEIPAGSDYYIKFYSENLTLDDQITPYTNGLSDNVKNAIAKSPRWIQRDLARQFQYLANPEEYANLILDANKKYTDKIAFSIACSPLGDVAQAEVIWDNAFYLYEIDKWIQYADIIDYDDGSGNYYSTIRYYILENGIEKQVEYPMEIYYWYIVHPELLGENAEYVYGKFWREYLFYHNDIGYPLLKEKLSNIDYLWDCTSYSQGGNRLWKQCIKEHPTAIEAVSYWIGKTVKYLATGDRPNQPNIIAHEHNGFCGEIQRISVAAQRSALVPSIGACNIGEDHVWREFYERGWHQNDNWWTDSGGTVDIPKVYADGWGKDMSAIYAVNGDSSIYEVTSTYIHPKDRVTVKFVVKDGFMRPADGALVTVLVKGIKDISWYKNKAWEIVEKIWDDLPESIKGKILQNIYSKIEQRFEEIPDVINGATVTIWNYTDPNGECTFELGKNDEYLFLIQQPELNYPWPFSIHNAIRTLSNTKNTTYNVFFSDFSNRVQHHKNQETPEGDCLFNVAFDTKSYQLHKNVRSKDIGIYNFEGIIDFFVLDEENFAKYESGKKFNCFNYIEEGKANLDFSASEADWYLVFRNHAHRTNVVLDFFIQVKTSTDTNQVQIVSPDTNIFDHPVFNVGDKVNVSGIATGNTAMHINGESIEASTIEGKWSYLWDTSDLMPGEYLITAECGNAREELSVTLIDETPPIIEIKQPSDGSIFEEETIIIAGESKDNLGVDRVEVGLDDSRFKEAKGTENWSIEWDVSSLDLGSHTIFVRSIDKAGRISTNNITIVINESGHEWSPEIIDFHHNPESPSNTSNVIIYANVTSIGPFDVKNVVLYCDNGTRINAYGMYRYGDKPVQKRHEEDPLQNTSNGPIYGYELGHFDSSETLTYRIIAHDVANNSIESYEKFFTIK